MNSAHFALHSFYVLSPVELYLLFSWALPLEHMMALDLTREQYFPLPFPLLSGNDKSAHTPVNRFTPI